MIVAGAFGDTFRFIADNPGFLATKALEQVELSAAALGKLTPEVIADALKNTEVLGKELVLSRLPDIWRSYVVNISHPMPTAALGGDANTGS